MNDVAVTYSGFNVDVVYDPASDDPLDVTDINDKFIISRGVLVRFFALVLVVSVCPYSYFIFAKCC